MDPVDANFASPRDALAAQIARYRAVAEQGGATYPSLQPGWDAAASPVARLDGEEDGPGGTLTLRIDGPIDDWFGVDLRALVRRMDAANPAVVNVAIDSPGGTLRDAVYLYNELRARARDGIEVNTEVRALAASAAVTVLLAGDKRYMQTGSQVMIHDLTFFGIVAGGKDEIAQQAKKIQGLLARERKGMLSIYVERTGQKMADLDAWVKAETWMDPAEAAERGFANAEFEDADPQGAGDPPKNEVSPEDAAAAAYIANKVRAEAQEIENV